MIYGSDLAMTRFGTDARGMERKKLKPGDRLADGTIWSGNTKLDGLKQAVSETKGQIESLQAQLAELEAEIAALEPAVLVELGDDESPKVNSKKVAKGEAVKDVDTSGQ